MSVAICLLMITSISVPITQNVGQSQNFVQSGPGPTSGGSRGLADSPWPMFRQNLNHTGVSPYDTSGNNGELKWIFSSDNRIISSPTIGFDSTIYVGSLDHKLYAINPDGTEKWNFKTGSFVDESSPAIGLDGTIYIGSRDNKLYAVNPDGTEKWNFTTGHDISSSPAIDSDGTIYVGSNDDKLYAINPDGTEKWNFMTGDVVRSSPAIDSDGTIYVGSGDHKLYSIYPDGTEKWNFTTGRFVNSSPAIGSNGTIYVGSYDCKLYAINYDGLEIWNYTTNGNIYSSPAIGFDGTIYVGTVDDNLFAINPDGTEKWSFYTGLYADVISSPAISSDGTIYIGSGSKKLHAVNPDGTEKWNFTIGSYIHSSPAIGSDGTIYIGSFDGNLYAIGAPIPDITVEKTANVSVAKPGDLIEYTIYYNNTGPDEAETVWINDTLPEGVTFITSSAEGNRTGNYNWTFMNVPAKKPTWYGPYKPTIRPPPYRSEHRMVYDSTNNRVVLFGGMDDKGMYQDTTWEYETATNTWYGPYTPTPRPSPREGHAMAYDSINNRVVLFGGHGFGNSTDPSIDETWEYDAATHTWYGPFKPTIRPPAYHSGHNMDYDSANNRVILFGGQDNKGRYNDTTWEYETATHTWYGPYTPTPRPSPREGHAMAYDSINNRIVLFGGHGYSPTDPGIDETWEYHTATHTWYGPFKPAIRPSAIHADQSSHEMVYDSTNNRAVLFGGKYNGMYQHTTWEYETATHTWYGPYTPTPRPSIREGHAMAYDSINNRVVLFGGHGFSTTDSNIDETWEYNHFIPNYFTITVQINSDVPNGTILTNYAHLDYTDSNGNMMLDSIDSADVLVLAPENKPPIAYAGPDQTVNEGDTVQFDASSSHDPDGIIESYEWDFDVIDGLWWVSGAPPDATGPTPTHTYGDDGMFIVTLRITDNDNLSATGNCNITVQNVDPIVTINSITMEVEIGLRVAGRKYNNVSMTLYEEGSSIGYVSIERLPGSPNEQMAWIPVSINFSKSYNATVIYTPEDPPNIGGNPVWIYIKSKDGSINKIHHTFNVQQSKEKNSNHWNHVEPWEVDLNGHFIGLPFEITSHVTDPGSDDEILTFSYGSQVKTVTYLNDPANPDPYPSPELKPVDIMDTTTLVYEGPGTVMLTVEDDDGGICVVTLEIS